MKFLNNKHLKEDVKDILTALDNLQDNQTVAFTLIKKEGYTNREIADITNTTFLK